MGFFENFINGTGQERPEELDKTAARLKKLGESVSPQNIEGVWSKLEPGLRLDLEELDIKDPNRQKELSDQVLQGVKQRLAEDSQAFKDIGKFTNGLENFPELKTLIDAKGPKGKAEAMVGKLKEKAEAYGLTGMIVLGLTTWAESQKKENNGQDTLMGKLLRKVAAMFGKKEDEEKSVDMKNKEKPVDPHQGLKDQFAKAVLALEASSVEQGLRQLAAEKLEGEGLSRMTEQALAKDGMLRRLYAAIQPKESSANRFAFRVTDILFQRDFSAEQIGDLVAAVEGKEEKRKYQLTGSSVSDIRTFLDAALEMKGGNLEAALKNFKRQEKVEKASS